MRTETRRLFTLTWSVIIYKTLAQIQSNSANKLPPSKLTKRLSISSWWCRRERYAGSGVHLSSEGLQPRRCFPPTAMTSSSGRGHAKRSRTCSPRKKSSFSKCIVKTVISWTERKYMRIINASLRLERSHYVSTYKLRNSLNAMYR